MSADVHRRRGRRAARTYFVGRRPCEAPEVYVVTRKDVHQLRPPRHDASLALDWHAGGIRTLALSRVLLRSVATPRLVGELEERFALDVLLALPADGFVLEADAILRWLEQARGPRGSGRLAQLRAVFTGRRR